MTETTDFDSPETNVGFRSRESTDALRVVLCGAEGHGTTTLLERLLAVSRTGSQSGVASSPMPNGPSLTSHTLSIPVSETDERRFTLIDTSAERDASGVAAALDADCALILVDASKGFLPQDQRHRFLFSQLGLKHIVLVLNKMDLAGYGAPVFEGVVETYQALLGPASTPTVIPVSALGGDNVAEISPNTPWYAGPTLIECLGSLDVPPVDPDAPLRMAVRHETESGGFFGHVLAGTARTGDSVRALPFGAVTTISHIRAAAGNGEASGRSDVALGLTGDVDVSETFVLAAADEPCGVADQFEAKLIWTSEAPLVSGRQYGMRLGTAETLCTPSRPKHRIDPFTLERLAAKSLSSNEVGICDLALLRPVAFEPLETNRDLGAFLLLDRQTGERVALGLINFALRRSTNVHIQVLDVDKSARAAIKGHRPGVLWFTGLSGSGKSTISNIVERQLNARGCHTIMLDGDNVRHGLNRDLGFTEADRAENIRRIAEVAKLMADAGLIALVSFISPFAAERRTARDLIGPDQFFEIFVDAPLAVAETRDPKGLYKKARKGEIKNFTGIGSPYEPPDYPDLHLETASVSAEEAAAVVMELLEDRGLLP